MRGEREELPAGRKALRFLALLTRARVARKLGTLVTDGYLAETGWVRSLERDEIVDAAGEPLPWATLPFVDFIAPRLRAEWSVFEYGAGASTLFYAKRVRRVTAVEHDARFAAQLRARLPGNAEVRVCAASGEDYAAEVGRGTTEPELVSVDGEHRELCVARAMGRLAPGGVLVLDDAERGEYAGARKMLAAAGFRAVEFWGLAAGGVRRKCTSVFYREGNVLGL